MRCYCGAEARKPVYQPRGGAQAKLLTSNSAEHEAVPFAKDAEMIRVGVDKFIFLRAVAAGLFLY